MQRELLVFATLLLNLNFGINGLTVSTFNLWNHMFNWNVRKIRIREMIHDVNSDIVALQEVRGGVDYMTHNQVQEVQAGLTSQFKWNIFQVANNVSFVKSSIHKDYPGEGLGLLSKLAVVESRVRYLFPGPRDPDKNKRLFLHVTVIDKTNHLFNIVVVHLSYYRQQQCRNVEEIINYINSRNMINVIIMGDFNTHRDFEGPVDMLLDGKIGRDNPCSQAVSKPSLKLTTAYSFEDAWKKFYPSKRGYTFSNMKHNIRVKQFGSKIRPHVLWGLIWIQAVCKSHQQPVKPMASVRPTPGLESRPDRILISSNLGVQSVHLDGNGSRYRQRYLASVHWERFCAIIYSSYLSYQGVSGYPCTHDCGPHGSCQCGVCIAVGNQDGCLLPDCEKCNPDVYRTLVMHCIACAVVLFHLSYAVVVVFVVAGGSYGETLYAILGCNCCLMNPKLFTTSTQIHARRYKILRLCKCWPVFRLPPYVQLLVSVIGLVFVYVWTRSVLAPQLDLAYSELAEEMYPSDHLMVTADIRLPRY